MKKTKNLIFIAALLILLVGLSNISATDVSDDTAQTLEKDTASSVQSVDAPIKNIKKEEQATDLYVSDNAGSDDNSGTNESPLKTLQGALDKTSSDGTYNIHIAEGTYKGQGNTNLTVNGNYNINIIGEGMNKTVFDGEAKYKIQGGTVWGSDDYWNPYDYSNANFFMTITEGTGQITLCNFNVEHMASIGGTSINAYPHATIDNYANLTVDNIYFYYNMAGVGSAIRNHRSGTVLMTNCLLTENRKSSSSGNDGVIYNNGTITIENTIFDHNAGRWGVILNDYVLSIRDSTLKNGISYDLKSTYKFGSGIATNSGNADYFNQYTISNIETIIENVTFENNGQTDIYQGSGLLQVNNCYFYNSTGIYYENANSTIEGIINGSTFKDMRGSTLFGSLSNDDSTTFAIYTVGDTPLLIENNTIISDNKGLSVYASSNKTIKNNNMTNIIVLAGNNNIVNNNLINTSNQAYGIQIGVDPTLFYNIDASNNTVENNRIYSSILTGQKAIKDNDKGNIIHNNTPETGDIIVLNDENYNQYFDEYSTNRENTFVNGSIIYVEDLTDKDLIFDNVKVFVTSNNMASTGRSILDGSNIVIHPNAKVMLNKLIIIKDSQKDNILLINSTGNYVQDVAVRSYAQTHSMSITADENYVNNLSFYLNSTSDRTSDSILKINSSNNEIKVTCNIQSQGDEVCDITFIEVSNSYNNVLDVDGGVNSTDNVNLINIADCSDTNIILTAHIYHSRSDINITNVLNCSNTTIDSDYIGVRGNRTTLLNIISSNNTYYASKTTSQNYAIANSINIDSMNTTMINIDNSINTTITSSIEFSNINIKSNNSRIFEINNSNNTNLQLMKIYEEKTNNNEPMIKFTNSHNNTIMGVEINYNKNSTNIINNANPIIYLLNSTDNTIKNYELDDYVFVTKIISNETSILLDNSDNNIINGTNITSNNNYTIILSDSNNNQIIGNILKGHFAELLGDDSILDNGIGNQLNNTPIRKRLTDENYNELFDDSTYKYGDSEILISSDLYDKDLVFPERVSIKNPNNYTLYNTTLKINKDNSIIDNLIFNSTKDVMTLITVNGDDCVLDNLTVYHEREGITRSIVINAEEITTINGMNIITTGSEVETEDNLPSIISIYSQSNLTINNSNIYTTYNNYDQKGTTNAIYSKYVDITYSNITTIGNNEAIGINTTKGESHQLNVLVEANTTAIGKIGHINESEGYYDRIGYKTSTLTVKSNDTAIGQMNDNSLYSILNVYGNKRAIGLLEINDTSLESGTYNNTINVFSNQTAYGVYFKNSGVDLNQILPIYYIKFWEECNLNVQGVNVTGVYLENVTGSGLSYANSIHLNGDNVIGVYANNISTYTSFEISGAKLIIDAKNFTFPLYSNNTVNTRKPTAGSISIKNTYIIVKNFNLTTPIININCSNKATVQNNYLLSDGVYGENAISVNATSSTIKNNKPTDLSLLETQIETEGLVKLYRDANNITVKVTDYYDIPMNGTVTVKFDNSQIFENLLLDDGQIHVTFTPSNRTGNRLTATITYTSANPTYQGQTLKLNNIPVVLHNITLTTNNILAITNEEVEITTNVVDDFERLVNEGKITYYDEYDTLIGESDVIDGVATLKTAFNQTYNSKLKTVYNATYIYNTSAVESTLKIVSPELTVNPVNITMGDMATITASILVDGVLTGDINDGRVYFQINGKILRNNETGRIIYADVESSTAVLDNISPKTWNEDTTIQAVYLQGTHKTNSNIVKPTITQSEDNPIEFKVADVTATAGSVVTITVTTKNLDSGKVVLKVNGKTVKADDGKLYAKVTSDTTTFTYTVPKTYKEGDYDIRAVYTNGNTKLEDEKILSIQG